MTSCGAGRGFFNSIEGGPGDSNIMWLFVKCVMLYRQTSMISKEKLPYTRVPPVCMA